MQPNNWPVSQEAGATPGSTKMLESKDAEQRVEGVTPRWPSIRIGALWQLTPTREKVFFHYIDDNPVTLKSHFPV